MKATETKLSDVRKAIDAIDNQMLALIDQRLALAKSLRALKPASQAAWAPAREHALLQRLLDQKSEAFPAKTMIAMWSALITCSLMTQGPFVLLCASDKTRALAGVSFPGAPVETLDMKSWQAQIANTPGAVAIMDFPGQEQNWWLDLAKASQQLFVQTLLPKWPTQTQSACCVSMGRPAFKSGQVCWTIIPAHTTPKVTGRIIAQEKGLILFESNEPVDLSSGSVSNQSNYFHIGSFFPSLLTRKSP